VNTHEIARVVAGALRGDGQVCFWHRGNTGAQKPGFQMALLDWEEPTMRCRANVYSRRACNSVPLRVPCRRPDAVSMSSSYHYCLSPYSVPYGSGHEGMHTLRQGVLLLPFYCLSRNAAMTRCRARDRREARFVYCVLCWCAVGAQGEGQVDAAVQVWSRFSRRWAVQR
jgi:hypothetical protein